jgi:pimeloyl-ACP methyl ester carboxylesterase
MKMLKLKLTLLHLLLPLLIFGSGCTLQSGADVPPARPNPQVELQDCQLSMPGTAFTIDARCGTLPVHEDPASQSSRSGGRSGGRTIDLAIAVIPAVSKNPQHDPLFMLAGGPGQSALETFPIIVPVFERLHQKRDIVLVDQRGTGGSNPLRCPEDETVKLPGEEGDPQEAARLTRACLESLAADTRLYTTAAFVADLDQVRQALGYEQVNLIGISYGTRVALDYQRQFPQHTRTVTLDSVNPLDWELGPYNPDNAQRALDLIFARCAADTACQNAFPDLQARFAGLLAGLEREPEIVSLSHPVTGELTQVKLTPSSLASAIQMLSYAPETVALIPLLIHTTAERGDFSLLAAQYLLVNDSLGQSIYDGLYLSVLCAEDAPFYPAAPGGTAPPASAAMAASYLPDHTADLARQCALWPHAEIPAAFKEDPRSEVPTLLLSGEADPITPPGNGNQVQAGLANSLHLVIPGSGHNVLFRGCLPKVITSFIESGSEKGLDTACVQEIKPAPFLLNFNGSRP